MGLSWAAAAWASDAILRESMLFAAVMFLLGGLDDLAVDLAFLIRRDRGAALLADLPPAAPRAFAIFVPAWDEARVIGAMLRTALARIDHPDYRIFVGCYPNDPATIDAVAAVAERDARVRLVIGVRAGPTTKADCLNSLWHALARADAAEGRHTAAIVLHDAEDVVHPAELRVFDGYLGSHALVQLPVVPLIDPVRRWVTGHYADEFAISHAVAMVVRNRVGASLPLAGVGCAIRYDALVALATGPGPFEPASLTEDYELGLRAAALGYRAAFVRLRERAGGPLVAVRAYFPHTLHAAVAQKARWMIGIALAGWDRTGWGTRRAVEYWMRMRDRRALLAMFALAAGYLALVAWCASLLTHAIDGRAPLPLTPFMHLLLLVNTGLLGWRLAARMLATAHEHGWREGLWSLPRALVGNAIALLAARRAVVRYVAMLLGRPPTWDKTAHRFPGVLP